MIHRVLASCEDRPVSHNPSIRKRVLLEAGELPALTNFSQAVFAPGDTAPVHDHADMWEVFFVRSGRGKIRVNGTEFRLNRDDCCAIEPGERHEIVNDGGDELVLLYFGLRATNV